jgi:hypothetical protein
MALIQLLHLVELDAVVLEYGVELVIEVALQILALQRVRE